MAAKVSQILTPDSAIWYGKDLKTGAASIEPGLLVRFESSGSTAIVSGSTAGTAPAGMAMGGRYSVYMPTTRVFASGEPFTMVQGHFLALLSEDFFDEGSLPSTSAALYGAVGGKLTTATTANKVGRSIGTRTRMEPVDGLGTSQDLALVELNFVP